MIRRGKTEGWLQLPSDAFLPWATMNEIHFYRTAPGFVAGKGGALLANEDLDADQDMANALLSVPPDLILSLERLQEHAKVDKDFREVLESLGEFGRTSRGAILSFLLVQASVSCPDLSARVSVHSPFTEYVKSLPLETLPTFWSLSELQLLTGTTLASAVSAKFKSLRREYDLICGSASHTRWYQIIQDHLYLDDWLQVDAMYRSRALELPGIGHCMVPCVDIANHAAGEATVAIYEKDVDRNAVLLLRDGKRVSKGDEVTITYGDEKGACEMLFSYGFLEDCVESAQTLFLSLGILEHENLRTAKLKIADCAPGFKLIDVGDEEIDWTGDFIWLLCVNEDDGLGFKIAQTVNGGTEIEAFFQDRELTGGAAELHQLLRKTDLWDVYRLRAVTILQQRVFNQMQELYSTQEDVDAVPKGDGTDIRERPYEMAMTLRRLEFELMEKAYGVFETQKIELANSSVVVRYLADVNHEPQSEPQEFS